MTATSATQQTLPLGSGAAAVVAKDGAQPAAGVTQQGKDQDKAGASSGAREGEPEGSILGDVGGEQPGKKADATAAADLAIKVPEGFQIDEAALKEFKGLAKEAGLNSESASKLVGWQLQRQKASEDALLNELNAQGGKWKKQLEADPDFGGPK